MSQKGKKLTRLGTRWWRIHLTLQGTRASSLVQKYSTFCGETACAPQLLRLDGQLALFHGQEAKERCSAALNNKKCRTKLQGYITACQSE